MTKPEYKIIKKDEYVLEEVDLKSSFEEKICEVKELNNIFTAIAEEMAVINNYGNKFKQLKEELANKFSKELSSKAH